MPNCYFIAKRRWEAQDLAGGVQVLNECLNQQLGGAAFVPAERIYNSKHFATFETAIAAMLADEHMRRKSFGSLFGAIWQWHPDQIWIGALLDFNVLEHFDRFGFDEALFETLCHLGGFDTIVDVLGESAAKGLLAPEFEGSNSGRPTLRIAQIERIKEERWGPLKQMLLSRLKDAYKDCPVDFWARLAATEPMEVLIRFLHDLFGNYPHPLDVIELRWRAICRDHAAYGSAVLTSLERILKTSVDAQLLADIVRIDAGFMSVEDGKQWMENLFIALQTSEFSSLPVR